MARKSSRGSGKGPGPSVKDKELYETLRREGNSKSKSARIANAAANSSRSAVGRRGGDSPPYDEWTRVELLAQAKKVGITGRSAMRKKQLIKALREH